MVARSLYLAGLRVIELLFSEGSNALMHVWRLPHTVTTKTFDSAIY